MGIPKSKLPLFIQQKIERDNGNELVRNAPRYKSRKVQTPHGIMDSGAEADYYELLLLREKAGDIKDLIRQVPVYLFIGRYRHMRVDFRYFDNHIGEMVWDEYKGAETAEWRMKRDLWAAYGPGLYRVTRKIHGAFENFLEIRPNPKLELVEAVIRAAGVDAVKDIIKTITQV